MRTIGGVVLVVLAAFLLASCSDEGAGSTTVPGSGTQAPGTTVPPPPTTVPEAEANLGYIGAWRSTELSVAGSDDLDVAVAPDGTVVIVFVEADTEQLMIASCPDPECDTVAMAVIDPGPAQNPALAFTEDGTVVVAYSGSTGGLTQATCNDTACSTPTITVVDTEAAGTHASVTIGTDGLPVISYFDETNADLRVAHCDTLQCDQATITVIDSTDDVGSDTSIAIGTDDLPVISYNDITNSVAKVAHCDNAACTTATTATLDAADGGGISTSIAIGPSGFPVVTSISPTTERVRFVRCNDAACVSNIGRVIPESVPFGGTSVAIDSSSIPMLSYFSRNGGLRVAFCADTTCNTLVNTPVDIRPRAGISSTLAVWSDGVPFVVHFNGEDGDLHIALPRHA